MESGSENQSARAPLYEALHNAQRFFHEQLKQVSIAVDYLKRRGVSGEIAAEFGIGFAPAGWDHLLKALGTDAAVQQNLLDAGLVIRAEGDRWRDRFRERVMFPIRDARGRIIGFGGRVIGNEEPKYLNSPETPLFHKGRELYGLYETRQALRDIPRLLVVEGYMDVVALHQHDLRYAVATLGTATTPEHLQKLFRVTSEVVFCFDGDRAGRAAAWRALENALPEAREGRQLKFLFLPEGEDPDTLVRKEGREAFESRLKGSVPLSTFLLDSLGTQTDLSSLDGRARLVELARPHLARLPSGVYRDMLTTELARRAQVDPEKLTMLNRVPSHRGSSYPQSAPVRPALTGPVRKALALLLHQPALAALAGNPANLANTELRGMETLQVLLEFAQSHPHITGAGLLEHWRDTETGGYLMKLAQAELVTPEEAMESEFQAVIADLLGRRDEQRLAALLDASRQRALASEEKAELAQLIKARRTNPGTSKP